MIRTAKRLVVLACGATLPAPAAGQGHGPIYGLSTPTLGRGEWSVDAATMGRFVEGGRALMARPMASYGWTEDLQLSASFPLTLQRDEGLPAVRGLTRMPMTRDLQLMVGWRFHRNALGVGARWESTAWVAYEHPTDATRAGIETAPALYGAAVTGYASRSWYLWGGAARRIHPGAAGEGGELGDTSMASLVVGYRPPAFRADYPHPDWRAFLELVGEWIDEGTLPADDTTSGGGRQVFLGITLLGLYGSWGISGGPALPLHQRWNGERPRERLRIAVNVTFWF